jgi:hypothetical protein
MSRPLPWPQRAVSSTSTSAGLASAATDVKVPSGSSVAALSAGTVHSPSSQPASAAADVKGSFGFSAAALSVGSRGIVFLTLLGSGGTCNRLLCAGLKAIAVVQLGCPEISALQQSSGLQLRALSLGGQHILCDSSTGVARPVIPADHRRGVFSSLHHIAHPGVRATHRLISSRFVWKSMNNSWCRECLQCNRGR